MRLIECYIEGFGKLQNFRYSFSEGLNVINEENGFGKTTLSAFIKAMFYGLDDNRRQKIEENDRKRYTPWGGGGFGGWLTIEVDGKRYRIERSFGAKGALDKFALYDLEGGNISDKYSENIGEELFSIDADGFERTLFLSEKKLSVKNDNKTISAKLSDLVGYEWDVGSLDEALDALEERRKYYMKKGGAGKINDIREKIAKLDEELIRVRQIIDSLPEREAKLSELHIEIDKLEKLRRDISTRSVRENIERHYLRLKEELDALIEKSNLLSLFFSLYTPDESEISSFEGMQNEARAIEESLRGITDNAEEEKELKENIENVNNYIDFLGKNGTKSKSKVPPVSLFALCAILAGLGSIFASVINLIAGIILISLSIIPLVFGVKIASEEKNKSNSAIGEITEYLKLHNRSYSKEEDFLSELIELRARLEASLSLILREKEELDAKRRRLCEIQERVKVFLSKFTIQTSEPFREIRRNLLELEMTNTAINNKKKEIESFAQQNRLDTEKITADEVTTHPTELTIEEIEEKIKALRSLITLTERSYREAIEASESIDVLLETKRELEDKLKDAINKYNLIRKAKEHLIKAKDSLTTKYLGKTRELFNNYITLMTGENADEFTLSVDFAVNRTEGASTHDSIAYSLGTREIYAIASRLALANSLYGGDAPFIILDDPFCHLDDTRCAEALKLLSKLALTKQIIYLTCSKSRTVN